MMIQYYMQSRSLILQQQPENYSGIAMSTGLVLKYLFIIIHLCLIRLSKQQCIAGQQGCQTCYDSYNCQTCLSGQWLATNLVKQCIACSVGCMTCTSSSCTKCYDGFVLVSSACTCLIGRGVNAVQQICSHCSQTHCLECVNNYQACQKCQAGYGVSISTGACDVCMISSCKNCQTDNTLCSECQDGQGINILGFCQACTLSECIRCSTNSMACTACASAYGISGGSCIACSTLRCIDCSTDASTCKQCQSGYGLSGALCVACNSTQSFCNSCSKDSSKCLGCQDGFGLILLGVKFGKCRPCVIPNCFSCSSNYSRCQACGIGYNLAPQGYCTNCDIDKCISCPGGPGTCAQCYGQYSFLSGSCQKCWKPYCAKCSIVNINICVECVPGAGPTGGGNCNPCDQSAQPKCTQCPTDVMAGCEGCDLGYGMTSGAGCQACFTGNCSKCTYDRNTCAQCAPGFQLSSGSCSPFACNVSLCLTCSPINPNICNNCVAGYGISGSGQCTTCTDQYCFECAANINICTKCTKGYGVRTGGCNVCRPNCMYCTLDSKKCTECQLGYGVIGSGECDVCAAGCHKCSLDVAVCTECSKGYRLGIGAVCVQCPGYPQCQACTVSTCTRCMPGYGVDPISGTCLLCLDGMCASCSADYQVCEACTSPYGVDSITNPSVATCVSCHSSCASCLPTGFMQCQTCPAGRYYQNLSCVPCMGGCIQCIDGITCNTCADNFYLSLASTCMQCLSNCYLCVLNSLLTPADVECTQCMPYYQLDYNSPRGCTEICGDSYVVDLPCDHPLGVLYDGCTDICQIQPEFNCRIDGFVSICSFNGTLQMTLKSISRQGFDNKIKLKFQLFPPLNVFKTTPNLFSVFTFSNPDLAIDSLQYDPGASQLIVKADILADLVGKSIYLQFKPSINADARYFASSNQQYPLIFTSNQQHMLYYYSPATIKIANIIFYFSYILVALSWISLILSLLSRRLAGLQAMIVVQFSFINVIWLNSYLNLSFQQMAPLKLSTFYNLAIIQEQNAIIQPSLNAPYTQQFILSSNLFVNNYNLCVLLQILPFLFYIVNIIRIHIFSRNQPEPIKNKKPDQLIKMQNYRQIGLQWLFYFTMFNLIYLCTCSWIFFKYGTLLDHASLVMFILSASITLFACVKFIIDPTSFDYFRYSFRYAGGRYCYQILFRHYLLYAFAIIAASLLMAALPHISFVPGIPILILLIYTLIARPYKRTKSNLRAAFNLFVMCSMVGLRAYIEYGPYPFHSTQMGNILLLLNYCLLLGAVVFVGLVSTVRHIVKLYFYSKQGKYKGNQVGRERDQILEMLDITDVHRKMKNIEMQNNIFKKIISPKRKLVDYSNQLYKQTIESQRQMLRDLQKSPNALDLTNLKVGQKGRKISVFVETLEDIKKNQMIRKKSLEKSIQMQILSIKISEELQQEDIKKLKEQKVGTKKKNNQQQQIILEKVISDPLVTRLGKAAKNTLIEQNLFINYKNSEAYVNKQRNRIKENNDLFEGAYDQIIQQQKLQ